MHIRGIRKTAAGHAYTAGEQHVPARAMEAYRARRERTLYLTDLDGTLLGSDQRIPVDAANRINRMVDEGMRFTYATARSLNTASKVTKGLSARMPLIVYNGAFVLEGGSRRMLAGNFFSDEEAGEILDALLAAGVSPIVYAWHEGREQFRYNIHTAGKDTIDFVATRKGDLRDTPVESDEALRLGGTFYFTCIDDAGKLNGLHEMYRDRFHCVYAKDIYSDATWLEIMPAAASKANAGRQLREWYGCTRVVSFGDSTNDIDMFEMSDECYAVANATDELKAKATRVIGSNDSGSVARWLQRRWNRVI